MSVSNLFKRGTSIGWTPDADATNAPDGALLRADNLVDDELGVLSVRQGSDTIHAALAGDDVHTIKTQVLADGNTHQLAGVGGNLYDNGQTLNIDFDGIGDMAMGDDSYQMFIARGRTLRKFDGSQLNKWGIPAPEFPATLAAIGALTKEVASFESGESPALVVNEGTSAFVNNYAGTASKALQLTPATTGRASVSKKFTSDQDFYNIEGSLGSDTDLFDMLCWFEEPKRVNKITIMFGLGTGTDPFIDDHFYFDFDLNNPDAVAIKDGVSASATAYKLSAQKVVDSVTAADVTNVKTPEEAGAVLRRLGRDTGPRSRERVDPSQSSPSWGHLSVPRGLFKRVGGTAGRDWSTIRGFKVTYDTVAGSVETVYLDSAVMTGGGDLALTGRFKFGYRFVRDTGTYIELSPLSPLSDEIVLNQQALLITVPSASLAGADPQVNQMWIYMNGGFCDTWYRCAVCGVTNNSSSQKLDEFDQAAQGAVSAADRTRLVNQGLSIPGFTPDGSVVLTLKTNDIQALIDNEALEPGAVGPPENIKAITGPWNSRMFTVTTEGWLYPSSATSPSNFSVYHAIDLRRYGTPLWMTETNGGIVVGMTKDIVRIAGTGDESTDRATIDLYPEPMTNANPPVDESFVTDGNAIIYRAADGLMTLNGASLSALSQGQTTTLWKGKNRHGVKALNITTGRFRMAVDNGIIYLLAPEGGLAELTDGSSNVIWRYNLKKSTWSRTIYPYVLRSICREPDGDLVVGTNEGRVLLIESGSQDDEADISVNVLTPILDGGNLLTRKDPHDLQIHCDTGRDTGTIEVFLDGNTASDASYDFSTSKATVYRINALDLGSFVKAQFRLFGAFNNFALHAVNLSYRERPQHTVALDSGYITVGNSDLVWIQEVELDLRPEADIFMDIYRDDVLFDTLSVPVVPSVRSVYRVSVPRGTKSRRLRLALRTSSVDAAGEQGFECYGIKVRPRGSGNQTDQGFVPIYPSGSAS